MMPLEGANHEKKDYKDNQCCFMAFSFVFTGINITYSPYEVYAFNEKLAMLQERKLM